MTKSTKYTECTVDRFDRRFTAFSTSWAPLPGDPSVDRNSTCQTGRCFVDARMTRVCTEGRLWESTSFSNRLGGPWGTPATLAVSVWNFRVNQRRLHNGD